MKSRKARRADGRARRSDDARATAAPELADRVAPYRAGYTPAAAPRARGAADRAASCSASSPPTRSSSASTSARSTPRSCVTFPGTVASLRQMWGRAGRRGRGLAVYVAGEDALDQFFCRHPDEFLERPVEAAILDHENEPIHLAAPAVRRARGPARPRRDAEILGPRWQAHADAARRARASCASAAAAATCLRQPEDYPAARVSLRSASPDSVAIVDVSSRRAARHRRGRARALDRPRRRRLPAPRALLRGRASSTSTRAARSSTPFDGDWYTQPKRETDTDDRAPARPPRGARRDAQLRRA